MLNYSSFARNIGFDYRTVKRYFDILESTYMVRKLKPFSTNLKSKIVKTPKLYIRDTGILHSLLNITDPYSLVSSPQKGESWEGLIVENLLNEFPEFEAYFYRTVSNSKIDLILQNNSFIIAVECKTSTKRKRKLQPYRYGCLNYDFSELFFCFEPLVG